ECEGSEQPMVVEEINTENNVSKITGIAIPEWFNNRFLRSSADHTVKEWEVVDEQLATLILHIVQYWCVDSDYLSAGAMVFDANYLKIPGLVVDSGISDNGLTTIPHFTGN